MDEIIPGSDDFQPMIAGVDDAWNANPFPQVGQAAAADDSRPEPGVDGQVCQNPAGGCGQDGQLGPGRDGRQSAVIVQQQQHTRSVR